MVVVELVGYGCGGDDGFGGGVGGGSAAVVRIMVGGLVVAMMVIFFLCLCCFPFCFSSFFFRFAFLFRSVRSFPIRGLGLFFIYFFIFF